MNPEDADYSPAMANYRTTLLGRARKALRQGNPLPLHLVAQLEDLGIDVQALEESMDFASQL
jgi:hypothetical protein